MLDSAKELVQQVLKHWLQALAGTSMALLGLVADANDWRIPPRAWAAASIVLFLWALLKAFHDVRMERDGLRDIRNYQRIADRLTALHSQGVGYLLDNLPSSDTDFERWNGAAQEWANEVTAVLKEENCTIPDNNHFATIPVEQWLNDSLERTEILARLVRIQIQRVADISTKYAQLAEQLHISSRTRR